jgi:thioredoxin 1
MNKVLFIILSLLFLTVGCSAGNENSKVVKSINEKDFKTEVLDSKIPVFVDFWAPWCGPCRIVGPIVEELAVKYKGKVKFVKVNVDDNNKLAAEYKINGIPAMLIIKKGKTADQQVGAAPKEELEKFISKNLK